MDLIAFILLSAALVIIPGPNVLVIVSTSLAHGRAHGLRTVAGTSTAMLFQLLLAAVGTGWAVIAISDGLFWLKWAGVCYLLYLGVSALRAAGTEAESRPPDNGRTFFRGFWVSLLNPKTIVFFGAFLPQFVSAEGSYIEQIVVLSAIFWSIAVVLDSGYALLASALRSWLRNPLTMRAQKSLSGLLYIGAGAALALANKEN